MLIVQYMRQNTIPHTQTLLTRSAVAEYKTFHIYGYRKSQSLIDLVPFLFTKCFMFPTSDMQHPSFICLCFVFDHCIIYLSFTQPTITSNMQQWKEQWLPVPHEPYLIRGHSCG